MLIATRDTDPPAGAFLDGREHREVPGLKKVGDEYKCAT